ncbi:MAG TPA: transketolase [Syntrophorhabdaceae bacterium]|nr:transketolase [Syntrophorhabdaceae bacterium]
MFEAERLEENEIARLRELSRLAKGDILTMTRLSGTGHPGGSISSLDIYLTLFSYAKLNEVPRDRIVVSHGHTSPGAYAALSRLEYLPIEEVVAFFRKAGSPFEGHVVQGIPFLDWSTGNLGQGLSAGCGFAIASKVQREDNHVYVLMGDGEQQKGQIGEARRFAKKYRLNNITVFIDFNRLQISGTIDSVMPQNIIENYLADGWDVLEINGHDFNDIYSAIRKTRMSDNPVCVIANTVMGNGISFMENKGKYHGSPLNEKEYTEALKELDIEDKLEYYKEKRKGVCGWQPSLCREEMSVNPGRPFNYINEDKIDNRTAFGKTLKDLGDLNIEKKQFVCAFDCDLAGSVKTGDFEKAYPDYFFQGGIQEHNTATVAGALSTTGILTFFADFGVFGIDETYNQQRLNDINKTNLKLIITHVGLDVGPDGKTHQCVDYIGLSRSLYNFKAIVPCDPNQMDRVVRYIASLNGNFLVATGRNRWPVISGKDGKPHYGEGYLFDYGKMDVLRDGTDGAIITYGGTVSRAIEISENLKAKDVFMAVVNMPCVNVIDEDVMTKILGLSYIVTYEDHNVYTGIAPVITSYLLKKRYQGKLESFGTKDYGASGDTDDVYRIEGLDVESMVGALLKMVEKL